ncbi:MAG TPA: glucose-6-phosphate isomerase, partial [Thermoanaerobaculia bacterium]
GSRFVAITDPDTDLHRRATQEKFRDIFVNPPDIGGRYSALSFFGMVPAALMGQDVAAILGWAVAMLAASETGGMPAIANPAVALGLVMGAYARAGRDKLTMIAPPALDAFGLWIEQLIAESTGKIVLAGGEHRGIVPVAGEPLGAPEAYGDDRFFAALLLQGDDVTAIEERLFALEGAGHPVARFHLSDRYDLGAEMFRWELATAAAGAVLGLNPFDQPDVQLAKELSAKMMKAAESGPLPPPEREIPAADARLLAAELSKWVHGAKPGDYLGVHAYLAPTPRKTEELRALQAALHAKTRLAVTLGYGPRFLHSTGQLHKGGTDRCRFLQLVDHPAEDLAVPETNYTYGTLIQAQSEGDRQALEQRGRQVLRVQLGSADHEGLRRLIDDLEPAS